MSKERRKMGRTDAAMRSPRALGLPAAGLAAGALALIAAPVACSSSADGPAETTGRAVAAQTEEPATTPHRPVQQTAVPRYVVFDGPGAIASVPEGVDPAAPRGSKLVMARAAELRARHAEIIPRLEALGAHIVADVVLVANVVQILVPASELSSIQALPGVARLETPTRFRRHLEQAVPLIGAPALWESGTPLTGQGMRIGIIDTGIDYFHADLGGAGDPNAYGGDDHTIVEANSFPTAKVVGGTDFVGDDYDGSGVDGSITPVPDPDPIDCGGHGTHVAGIAAGTGVDTNHAAYAGPFNASLDPNDFTIMPGVAPEASLYALKIFGCNGPTWVLIPAFEWAADPDGDTNPSDRLDVVNASLGEDFDVAPQVERDAIVALTAAGSLFVAAQGNGAGADRAHFTAGFPASVPEALAVGATFKTTTTDTFLALEVTSPGSVAGTYPMGEGAVGPNIGDLSTVTAEVALAEPELACDALTNPTAVAGKLALVKRGTCQFVTKAGHAADAGATGILIVNNTYGDFPMHPFSGASDPPTIPMWSLRRSDGEKLWPEAPLDVTITDGVTTNVPVGPDYVAPWSSRGPTVEGLLLKPDLAAPGVDILAPARGSGFDGVLMSGTSMATPVTAGAATLLRQGLPALGPLDIKERMVSTGKPVINGVGEPFPATIAGAGRLQIDDALAATITARVDGLPGEMGVSFGSIRASSPVTETRTVIVSNSESSAATIDLAIVPALEWPGTTVDITPTTVTVPAGGTETFTITLSVDPAQLPPSPAYEAFTGVVSQTAATGGIATPNIFITEASGTVTLTPLGENDVVARVAYHGVVQPTAERSVGAATGCLPGVGTAVPTLPLEGAAAPHGNATSVLELGTETSSFSDPTGPDAARDVVAVGHLANPDLERVYFGIVTAGDWTTPARGWWSEVGIEVDIDDDQVADYLVLAESFYQYELDKPDTLNFALPMARSVQLTTGAINGIYQPINATLPAYPGGHFFDSNEPETHETHVYFNRVLVFPVAYASLGLNVAGTAFAYRGVSKVSRWPLVVGQPMAEPLDTTDWVTFDADAPKITLPESHYGSPLYPEDDSLELTVHAAADELPSLLVLHHANGADPHYETVDLTTLEGSDLSVTAATAGEATVGEEATASFTIENSAASPRTGVVVTFAATGGDLTDIAADSGTCTADSCDLGTLAAGASVTIDVTVVPDAEGTLTVTATVAGATDCETDTANDEASATHTVGPAPASPSQASEEDSGCGCRMTPSRGLTGWGASALLLILVGRRRRRRG